MGSPVVHWEISSKNDVNLKRFYADLFDWKVDANNPMNYGMVETGGEGINGGISEGQAYDQYVTVYVQVADPQAALEKAERLGGKTVMPVTEIPGAVTMAQFTDPAGNMIGLIKG